MELSGDRGMSARLIPKLDLKFFWAGGGGVTGIGAVLITHVHLHMQWCNKIHLIYVTANFSSPIYRYGNRYRFTTYRIGSPQYPWDWNLQHSDDKQRRSPAKSETADFSLPSVFGTIICLAAPFPFPRAAGMPQNFSTRLIYAYTGSCFINWRVVGCQVF
jgi:hypothetical protein